jgi:hypothetical protein
MKAKKLIAELKEMNGNLEVYMFAHDQNRATADEGDGEVFSVEEVTDNLGKTFIALCS